MTITPARAERGLILPETCPRPLRPPSASLQDPRLRSITGKNHYAEAGKQIYAARPSVPRRHASPSYCYGDERRTCMLEILVFLQIYSLCTIGFSANLWHKNIPGRRLAVALCCTECTDIWTRWCPSKASESPGAPSIFAKEKKKKKFHISLFPFPSTLKCHINKKRYECCACMPGKHLTQCACAWLCIAPPWQIRWGAAFSARGSGKFT